MTEAEQSKMPTDKAQSAPTPEMAQINEINERNARCSAGCSNEGDAPVLLSPAQVRAMDRREVRDNYALILESMKHWQ